MIKIGRLLIMVSSVAAILSFPLTAFGGSQGHGGHQGGGHGGGHAQQHKQGQQGHGQHGQSHGMQAGNQNQARGGPQGGPGRQGQPAGRQGQGMQHPGMQHANPGSHAGNPQHLGNVPGPMGGQGAGAAWKDNPAKKDNPPGLLGGRGTDFGNPPGPFGGQGSGPAWRDNPNQVDNPPGLFGGSGTDFGNFVGTGGSQESDFGNATGNASGGGQDPSPKQMLKKMADFNQDGSIDKVERARMKDKMQKHFGQDAQGFQGENRPRGQSEFSQSRHAEGGGREFGGGFDGSHPPSPQRGGLEAGGMGHHRPRPAEAGPASEY